MSKEYKLEFNNNYIVVEEPYEKDKGIVVLSKTDDCSLHILYESYNPTHIDFFIKLIKYVADLEAKLAESEETIKYLKGIKRYDIGEMLIENTKLKQQLAEKEKENDNLYNRLNSKQKFYEMGLEKDYKEYLSRLNKIKKEHNKDKISFAVEQLTEIRDYVKECWSLDTTEGKVRLDIAKKIRLKIEELTHQHEDKGE